MKLPRILASVLLLGSTLALLAQTASELPALARQAYEEDSWEKAFALVTGAVPESSANGALKSAAADSLTALGVEEYDMRNFRNAYEGFRKALKYNPTNPRATQYFLKIRKEMDTSKLQNEGAPRNKATALAPAVTAPAAPVAAPPVVSAPAVAAAPIPDVRLDELKTELETAGKRLQSMESNVISAGTENTALKAQVDQQLKLLQGLMEAQAAQAQQAAKAPQPTQKAAAAVAAPQQSAQERALVAKTMELLAKMAEREQSAAPIVIQSDPDLKNIVLRLSETQKSLADRGAATNYILLIVIGIVILAVGSVIFLFLMARRARKQNARQRPYDYEGIGSAAAAPQSAAFITATRSSDSRLLEFISSDSSAVQRAPEEFDIRRDLLKAERLKRMYEEVRAGSLSWNTVRDYIGELDIALRTEILKVVENKLNEGDLISSEAVLPVLFPFLSDYSDFLREKSKRLAKQALIEYQGKDSEAAADDAEISDPFSLRSLLSIPKQLHELFKGLDQSLVTAKLSRGIGNTLGMSTEDCNLLYKSALAHDCGYLMLDRERIKRTIAKQEIDEEDFLFIQSHAAKGLSYFGEIELPEQFKAGLIYHHERNDGSGYPDALKKDAIPLFAKIIGAAETFASLISKRSYRDKHNLQYALAIISDGARSKFDPSIVAALTKVASALGNS